MVPRDRNGICCISAAPITNNDKGCDRVAYAVTPVTAIFQVDY